MSNIFKTNSRFSLLFEENNKSDKKSIFHKEKKMFQVLTINNFPELISINNKKTSSNQMNFLNVIKKVETKCNEDKIILDKYVNLKPNLKKIDISYKKEVANEVFKKLAELYEKRNKEYIELWGYDEWKNMFIFSNYDYDYFDKLDEKYAEEIKMEETDLEDTNFDDE